MRTATCTDSFLQLPLCSYVFLKLTLLMAGRDCGAAAHSLPPSLCQQWGPAPGSGCGGFTAAPGTHSHRLYLIPHPPRPYCVADTGNDSIWLTQTPGFRNALFSQRDFFKATEIVIIILLDLQ